MSETDDAVRTRELTVGPQQAWVNALGAAVRAQDIDALDDLAESDDARLLGVVATADEAVDEFTDYRPSQAIGAAASLDLARALLDPRARTALLEAALEGFRRNRLVSPAGDASDEVGPGASPTIAALQTRVDTPAAAFAELMTLVLEDRFPTERGAPALIPVLFDTGVNAGGLGGHLRVVRLADGPPGLHPDPRRMAFSEVDDAFCDAVRAAWGSSSLIGSGACVIWSLRDGDDVLLKVHGASLGAAFAVALDELAPSSSVRRYFRRRSLDPHCAVTGRLMGDEVRAVEGYGPKLAAAAERRWRVIVPAESASEVAELRVSLPGLQVDHASTIAAAIRSARRRINRRFIGALVVLSAIVLGGGGGAAAVASSAGAAVQAESVRRAAADLAAQSREVGLTNPRLAALTALAAFDLDPTVTTTGALQDVAEANAVVVKARTAHDGGITATAAAGEYLVTAGADGTVALWSPELEEVERFDLGVTPDTLVASGDGSRLAASTGFHTWVFDVDEDGMLTQRGDFGSASLSVSAPVGLSFTPDDEGLIAVFSSGLVREYTLDGNVADDTVITDTFTLPARPGTQAHLVDAVPLGDGMLLVADAGDVLLLSQGQVQTIVARDDLPAPARTVQVFPGGRDLLVGTEAGVVMRAVASEQKDVWRADNIAGVGNVVDQIAVTDQGAVAVLSGSNFAAETVTITGPGVAGNIGTVTGAHVAAVGDALFVGAKDGRLLRVGASADPTELPSAPGSTVVAFTPEGDLVRTVTGSSSNQVRAIEIIDVDDDARPVLARYDVDGSIGYVNDVVVTNELVLAGGLSAMGATGVISGWDRETEEVRFTLTVNGENGVPPIVSHLAVDGEGRWLMSYTLGRTNMDVWALDEETPSQLGAVRLGGGLGSLETDVSRKRILALSWPTLDPAASDHELTAIDVASGARLWHRDVDAATRMTHNPVDGTVAVLNGQTIELLSADGEPLERTGELPEAGDHITWSPDGTRIAVTVWAGRVYVLDASTLLPVLPAMPVPTETAAYGLAWSPDSEILAVSTPVIRDGVLDAGELRLFRVDNQDWASRMCAIAGEGMSRAEWERLVGVQIPYRHLCAE